MSVFERTWMVFKLGEYRKSELNYGRRVITRLDEFN